MLGLHRQADSVGFISAIAAHGDVFRFLLFCHAPDTRRPKMPLWLALVTF